MSVNFAIAGDHADIVHSLAIIESNENPAAVGDGGRAFGLLQQHPAFFTEFYMAVPDVADDWPTAQIRAATEFFDKWLDRLGLDLAVQAYNRGIEAIKRGQRNPEYLARFSNAYQHVRSGAHKNLCKVAA